MRTPLACLEWELSQRCWGRGWGAGSRDCTRHVTSENLHAPMVLGHPENTIYGISKIKEKDTVKTTVGGVMEKRRPQRSTGQGDKPPGRLLRALQTPTYPTRLSYSWELARRENPEY